MMKKITRIAALLAATAFLLAGFPACSDDDDGDGDPTLTDVEIAVADEAKTEYKVGDEFDKTGITVTATYSNNTTKDVTAEATFAATCDGEPFTTEKKGTFDVTLTATYGGKTAYKTCEITVKDESDNDPTLTDIEVTTENTVKTEYKVGDEFDKSGITVTATYSDNSTKDVTANATIAVTYNGKPFTTEKAGTFDVTLTATYGGKTASATGTITVKERTGDEVEPPTLVNIEVTTKNTVKTEYTTGDEFDKTGITVTATYSDDSTKDVTANATIAVTYEGKPFTTEKAGTFDVTLTATYNEKTASATRTITVKDKAGGEVVENPTVTDIKITVAATVKTEYTVGDEFDKTGITVTATYSNNTTKDVTDKATITATSGDAPFTTATAGTFDVTLTATYEGKTAKTEPCTITVKDKTGGEIVENPTLDDIKIAVAATVKTEYTVGDEFDKTGITVTATYSNNTTKDVTAEATFAATCDGEPFTTEKAGTFEVTLTATYGGKTASATSTITVKAKGTTYAWNFQTTELSTVLSYATADDGKDCLDAEGTYEATPAGLTLVLPKNLKFNKIEPTVTASGASNGAIQPLAGDNGDIYVEVQGPFTAEMLYASNGGDKTDRSAYIKIGEEKKAESEGTLTNAVSRLSYTYDGTDTVKVSFGGTNYIRIYDIKITTENGDGTGKKDGEVISKAVFEPTTDGSTANDVATLGLEGTDATSSDPEVATAKIEGGNVVIKSVSKAGSATITVTDAEGNAATIKVTVIGTGKITEKSIIKYRAPAAPGTALPWTTIVGDEVAFTDKAIVISKNSGIYLPVTYEAGKKVMLSFTVDKASVNADTGNKICGGFAQDDSFGNSTLAVFASNKGISNGQKAWNAGGSNNGYSSGTNLWTGKTEAKEDVTFTVTYTIGQESKVGTNVVLTGTITDGTTSDKKEVKQKDMKWGGTVGTVQNSVVPYISFGSGNTDSITVSNITLTVDDEPVATTAD